MLFSSYACLKALVSKVSQSVEKSTKYETFKIHNYLMGLIWRHFWAWLCVTNARKLAESKYQAGFGVIILSQNPLTFVIPIYITWYYCSDPFNREINYVILYCIQASQCPALKVYSNKCGSLRITYEQGLNKLQNWNLSKVTGFEKTRLPHTEYQTYDFTLLAQ